MSLLLLLLYTCFRYYCYIFLLSSSLVLIAIPKDTLLDLKSRLLSSFYRGVEAGNSVLVFDGIIKRINTHNSEPSERVKSTKPMEYMIILYYTRIKFNLSYEF